MSMTQMSSVTGRREPALHLFSGVQKLYQAFLLKAVGKADRGNVHGLQLARNPSHRRVAPLLVLDSPMWNRLFMQFIWYVAE